MKNWLREFGRHFKSGVDRAYGKTSIELAYGLLQGKSRDSSITDDELAKEILDYLSKFPGQREMHNFSAFLNRVCDERPSIVKILSNRLNIPKK